MPRKDGTGPLGQSPGGNCICPQCGMNVAHKQAVPCVLVKCPKCGIPLVRE